MGVGVIRQESYPLYKSILIAMMNRIFIIKETLYAGTPFDCEEHILGYVDSITIASEVVNKINNKIAQFSKEEKRAFLDKQCGKIFIDYKVNYRAVNKLPASLVNM